jgi:uncharacterized delta-60 repeat protein
MTFVATAAGSGRPRTARPLLGRAARALALGALTACTVPAAAGATAGDPDPTFGTAGRQIVPGRGEPVAVLVQPDGRTLVVMEDHSTTDRFLVTRLSVDGSLDRSYGGDGSAAADFGAGAAAAAAALQPDGKLVVAGSIGSNGMAVARFQSDGSLDPSFDPGGGDGDGKKVIEGQRGAVAVVVQEDGEIALATTRWGGTADLSVVRLFTNGAPDATPFERADFGGEDTAVAAAGIPDTALVVAGRATVGGKPVTTIVRYTLEGKLDPVLAGTGKVTVPAVAEPKSVHVTPDERIVVTGTSGGADSHTVVARLNRDGTPDPGFGTGGVVAVDFDGTDMPAGAALAPDGRILVGGATSLVASPTELDSGFHAARVTAAGALDPAYGRQGLARVQAADLYALATATDLAPDGRLVVAGLAVMNGPVLRTVVTRLTADPPPRDPGTAPDPRPDPRPMPDTQPPELSDLRLAGPYARFTLTEPARVRLKLARSGRGAAQSFKVNAADGVNKVRLARRIRAGRYRLTATPTDAAGNAGRTQRLSATIKKGRS